MGPILGLNMALLELKPLESHDKHPVAEGVAVEHVLQAPGNILAEGIPPTAICFHSPCVAHPWNELMCPTMSRKKRILDTWGVA